MIAFLTANLGTIIIGLIIAGIIAAIMVKTIRDKQKGRCAGCDCGYGNCSNKAGCDAK